MSFLPSGFIKVTISNLPSHITTSSHIICLYCTDLGTSSVLQGFHFPGRVYFCFHFFSFLFGWTWSLCQFGSGDWSISPVPVTLVVLWLALQGLLSELVNTYRNDKLGSIVNQNTISLIFLCMGGLKEKYNNNLKGQFSNRTNMSQFKSFCVVINLHLVSWLWVEKYHIYLPQTLAPASHWCA